MPAYEYRDGGLVGDALVEQFVRTAPAHLTPDGIAQLLGNWESRTGITGLARLDAWVPADLDLWVVEREELSPLAYAELWIRDGGITPRDAAFTPLLTAWLDDFAARGVTAIGFGYVLLRRGGEPLRRSERVTQPVANVGAALGLGLAAHDALAAGLPDTLVVAPDVTEARHLLPGNDDPSVIELRQGGGFARTVAVDPALAGFVGACDGELQVLQIAPALADLFEVPFAQLWAELEPRIRGLVLDGFLLPGNSPGFHAFEYTMKAFGFLSFGHYADVPGSATRTAGDMLKQTIEIAEGADELGVNGAYVRVHHWARQAASPMPLLTAMAARTERIEVGTGVIDMRYENPFQFAEEAAALDLIADGRIALGVSRGSPETALRGYETFGFRDEEDPERGSVLAREKFEIFLRAIDGERLAPGDPGWWVRDSTSRSSRSPPRATTSGGARVRARRPRRPAARDST